ncbi:MAG: metallophosphoesterase [Oculatellaceae cyanobacterium Prado106]|jgi:3',5'-cyclic AMP phosphodiesterase CpdA|nr:metallophosphoesterase [Oculatellaceae cyanobacterium Prado106]
MNLNFRFAIISDPHIALPHTIWDNPSRFHLVEISIPALEVILDQLAHLDLDFLLLPGDLTQHGEPDNHRWLADRLAQLPYPAYVIPGNHDIIERAGTEGAIAAADFPHYYQKFGYDDPQTLYYSTEVLPGVRLIGLNSIFLDEQGKQIGMGRLEKEQLDWLKSVLDQSQDELVLVMVHHNVIEHLPGQTQNPLGRRYMLENAADLLSLLEAAGVQLLFTGHLHVQDIAQQQGIYEITTGSLVSYPHPYRILEFRQTETGDRHLKIESGRVTTVPGWDNLQQHSREWMGDRSLPFMLKLLTQAPLHIQESQAALLAPHLRYFWADIANGDAQFDFPQFPPAVNRHFAKFGAKEAIDNQATLQL